jgi:toxin secretion/phage lysis holin
MKFIDTYNSVVGIIITVLTAVFGVHWYLFAAFLVLNIIDWLTGWWKSRKLHTESSYIGLKGILKKLGYWVIVLIAFMIPRIFTELGTEIGVQLDFLNLFGWFVLAMLMVNEIRSVLENLVELGYEVPDVLIKGLAVTEKLIHAASPVEEEKSDD